MSEFFEYERNNEALRLIQHMDDDYPEDWDGTAIRDELRRLHEAHDWQYRMAGDRLRRIEKLEAERDALKADAERYRWLRDHMWAQSSTKIYALPISWEYSPDVMAGGYMDAAIDAARADK